MVLFRTGVSEGLSYQSLLLFRGEDIDLAGEAVPIAVETRARLGLLRSWGPAEC